MGALNPDAAKCDAERDGGTCTESGAFCIGRYYIDSACAVHRVESNFLYLHGDCHRIRRAPCPRVEHLLRICVAFSGRGPEPLGCCCFIFPHPVATTEHDGQIVLSAKNVAGGCFSKVFCCSLEVLRDTLALQVHVAQAELSPRRVPPRSPFVDKRVEPCNPLFVVSRGRGSAGWAAGDAAGHPLRATPAVHLPADGAHAGPKPLGHKVVGVVQADGT